MDVMKNLLESIPTDLSSEVFETLAQGSNIKIERIISKGHSTPNEQWYDQDQDEWVMVLQGHGILEFESGETLEMKTGDSINIAAHKKHKVKWTDPKQETIWLAVFYDN
ncbi:MAG: cupin domain-containing protein [Bermanella sp.]